MPGHVKKGSGPDPDPSPWLEVKKELKKRLLEKPHDIKKSCWVPNKGEGGGYLEGLTEKEMCVADWEAKGVKVDVNVNGEIKQYKSETICQINPPKFDCAEDMADLTFLGDACILWNSQIRYINELIYTYSGLFCIAINPYKRYPIYTVRTMEMYVGKRRNECWPHIFAVAEGAYQGMQNACINQSILITGESGAGKTENTKKVISYFATMCSSGKRKEGEASLEDKIVQTNPVLEAWGNAKTVRNDNSSRFGKFIRIHFNAQGKLSGADMVIYLLEKSRLTYQQPLERCYHAFYNLMSDQVPDLKEKCLLSDDILDYWYVSQGKLTVPSINDKEDMQFADEAFDILGFTQEEKYDVFKNTAVMMHMGNMTKDFIPVGQDMQAEVKEQANSEKVAELLGIDCEWMITYFCKPKLKVGTEWVQRGNTCENASNSVAGIARAIYERTFRIVAEKCNETLCDPKMKRVSYIGVLDIAGFEIFDFNTFEQICINYVNEKLQQFFNQHMFTLEQEEYVREGLDWANVDFGMDLQKCIDMFEKPMALLAIFEEESLFPKATDETFKAKLDENLLGKWPNFCKPNPKAGDPDAHFGVIHYAAMVSYNLTGWLEKNKDPLNDTIVQMIKEGGNNMAIECFKDHPGQPLEPPKNEERKKGKGGKTVSSYFKGQLDDLMGVLYKTEPHFIRCMVSNTIKTGGAWESGLVMHQYTCNGVLAGIAICRAGFPNKMVYPEFKARYNVIAAKAVAKAKNDKAAAGAVMLAVKLEKDKFRLGHTKVFFRAGTVGMIEEVRDECIKAILNYIQALCRGYLGRIQYKIEIHKRESIPVMQRNFKKYLFFRDWSWYNLLNGTKRFIGQEDMEAVIAKLEEEAAIACSAYDKEVNERDRLNEEISNMVADKKAMMNQIEQEQGDLSSYQQDLARATTEKQAKEDELAKTQKLLVDTEAKRNEMIDKKRRFENDLSSFRKDIDDMNMQIQKAEQEKTNRDHTIRNLNDEIAHQDELINKLTKEKKYMQESQAKSSEELSQAEEKVDHLNKVKQKLEVTLDELEDSHEREKKSRLDMEKQRRKIEADLKVTQEVVIDLERDKKDFETMIEKKDKDIHDAMRRLEDEQVIVAKLQKAIKELQGRIESQEEELEAERQARTKAEKQRGGLARELDDLSERVEEAGGATQAQVDLNKKREAEINKLRRDLEEANIQHDGILVALKKKHVDATSEMSEQVDQLNKMKQKIEKERHAKKLQIDEIMAAIDVLANEKASLEKQNTLLNHQLSDVNRRCGEASLTLSDYDNARKKTVVENVELLRNVEELDNNNMVMSKIKSTLQAQLGETKKVSDDECKERGFLLGKYRNQEHEVDLTREQLEEEAQSKADALRLLSKSVGEAQMWRQKYEKDGLARAEELESAKLKLQSRLAEAEGAVQNLNGKATALEREKMKLQSDIEEMTGKLDDSSARCMQMEKKAKNFDKIVVEWKAKIDSLQAELDQSQVECRSYSTELFKVKTAYEETMQQLDQVRRENKNLSTEIKDIMDQIGEGGRTIHEIDKIRKRLENEKLELQAALEEAEGALEQEENKVLRAQLELSQVKQEIERRIKEKEEEFEGLRKTHQRAVESMQSSLENESKAKNESFRHKKKLEADLNELDIALQHANGANAEAQQTIKKYQNQIREAQQMLETEQQYRDKAREQLIQSERKAHAVRNELEETKTQLEHADRQRRTAEQELSDVMEQVADSTLQNQALQSSKRKLDSEMQTMQADLEEMLTESRIAEEKAKKAMIDAARIADELRAEQENAQMAERNRRVLDNQVKDMQTKLDEAEQLAVKGGKKVISRLEQKIKDLEGQLDDEQRRLVEAQKSQRRTERRVKELTFSQEEDQKNHERMQELVDKLQNKVKSYKKQIEEAEEIAALNLAKFRKVQADLEQAEERADINEQVLAKYKARGRGASVGP